ncbi:AAA family ATPase [Planktothrix sp. FACHB-1355]|uniref:division plane positioning ATPase MipZ n=1 Tax=Planktothrix sp. FACHB-1355 TaxID=2692854 RepID=UPI00168C05B2|nr:division plane positioning ATPase MipZ [Planktothrix sp. FACHB-1355]MBD3557525.1 AAA family ATPase [Planktothrix sp. FACHB-1355]MBD3885883.1 AAA family ATPase [Phormidium tenue FACHB-886]
MIICVGGQKGGTGKSTTAVCLAAWLAGQGRDVLLVDANVAQGTASNWAERRSANEKLPRLTCIEKSGNIYDTVRDLAKKYDEVIIDSGGQDSKELRTALPTSHLLLTPTRPSQADIETLVYVADLVDKARDFNPKLEARVIITNAPPNPAVKLVEEAKELLAELSETFSVCSTVIYNRKAYIDALTAGMGVSEMNNTKAAAEIESLGKEIMGWQKKSKK